jgi:hypothetical protein
MTRAIADAQAERRPTGVQGGAIRRELLTRDPEVQARSQLDRKTVKHYAALIEDGVELPPLTVFDDGEKLYIADGFLRDAAAELAGLDHFPCDVRRGTRRDALLYSIGANSGHGLPFTRADKRRAVAKLLRDEEWRRWSDTEIARHAGVGKSFVSTMRRELQPEAVGAARLARRGAQVYEMRPAAPPARASATTPTAATTPTSTPTPTPAGGPAQPTTPQKTAPVNYATNWLFYLTRMSPAQLLSWQKIIKSRVDVGVLAEAVDVVMRQTPAH